MALLLAVLTLLSLAACAGSEEAETDKVYSGDYEKGISGDAPEEVRTAIVQMRSNTPPSVIGADGARYSGKREFVWDVADYLASGGYKHLGEWSGGKYADIDGTVVTYRSKDDNAEVCAVIDYAAPSVAYYSKNINDPVVYYSSVAPSAYEEYNSNSTNVSGISVSSVATGFTYDRVNDVRRTWAVDANGYKYTTGDTNYLISNTNIVDDDGDAENIFYVYTSGGGYEVRTDCAYLDGMLKLAMYEETVDTEEKGKVNVTYVATVGKDGELSWPDSGKPTTYGTCSYAAVTAGRGWLWQSIDYDIDDLTMIAIGQGKIIDSLNDYTGLLNSVGITFLGFNLTDYYGVKCSVLGVDFDTAAAEKDMNLAVDEMLAG